MQVFGYGPGVLSNKSVPDDIVRFNQPEYPGLEALVWNLQANPEKFFPINSTVFFSPATPGKRSKDAFLFHHGT